MTPLYDIVRVIQATEIRHMGVSTERTSPLIKSCTYSGDDTVTIDGHRLKYPDDFNDQYICHTVQTACNPPPPKPPATASNVEPRVL